MPATLYYVSLRRRALDVVELTDEEYQQFRANGNRHLDDIVTGDGSTPSSGGGGETPHHQGATLADHSRNQRALEHGGVTPKKHDGAHLADHGRKAHEAAKARQASTPLKDFIARHEGAAEGYDTVYAHGRYLKPPKPVSDMTIAEVLQYQKEGKALAGSAAYPVGRYQFVHDTLERLAHANHIDINNTKLSPQLQEKFADELIAGTYGSSQALRGQWDFLRHVSDEDIRGAASATPSTSPSSPTIDHGRSTGSGTPENHPYRYGGTLRVGNETFDYASGGHGRGSSPPGEQTIVGFTSGEQRAQTGHSYRKDAFEIAPKYDPELHSTREGVLIHQSGHGESSSDITSSGCFAIAHSQWDRAKAAIQQKLAPYGGRGTLRVGPDGNAEVLPPQSEAHKSMAHDPLYEGVKWGGGG